jgi:hypothetical protein
VSDDYNGFPYQNDTCMHEIVQYTQIVPTSYLLTTHNTEHSKVPLQSIRCCIEKYLHATMETKNERWGHIDRDLHATMETKDEGQWLVRICMLPWR